MSGQDFKYETKLACNFLIRLKWPALGTDGKETLYFFLLPFKAAVEIASVIFRGVIASK